MLIRYFCTELDLSQTPKNTKQKKGISTIPIVAEDEFVRDLRKPNFLYPLNISQTQMEKRPIHDSLLELNIWL